MLSTNREGPTERATLERASRLANRAMFTIALQVRRLASDEPEDELFVFRKWADWEFLIVALWRLRRAAELAASTSASESVGTALVRFDEEVPDLRRMRNVAEHFDEYAADSRRRHDKTIDRRQLEVGQFNSNDFAWIGRLNAQEVKSAAERLYQAMKTIKPPGGGAGT